MGSWRHTVSVYPHVCGAAGVGFLAALQGSRSIPTCAGQPNLSMIDWVHLTVYPHVCGAAYLALPMIGRASGLSPRVRGSLSTLIGTLPSGRSIPTCAGQPLR